MVWWILTDIHLGVAFLLLLRIGWLILDGRKVGWRATVAYVALVLAAYSFGAVWLAETTPNTPPQVCSGSTR